MCDFGVAYFIKSSFYSLSRCLLCNVMLLYECVTYVLSNGICYNSGNSEFCRIIRENVHLSFGLYIITIISSAILTKALLPGPDN